MNLEQPTEILKPIESLEEFLKKINETNKEESSSRYFNGIRVYIDKELKMYKLESGFSDDDDCRWTGTVKLKSYLFGESLFREVFGKLLQNSSVSVDTPIVRLHFLYEYDDLYKTCSLDREIEKGRLHGKIKRENYKLDLSKLAFDFELSESLENLEDSKQVIEAIKRMNLQEFINQINETNNKRSSSSDFESIRIQKRFKYEDKDPEMYCIGFGKDFDGGYSAIFNLNYYLLEIPDFTDIFERFMHQDSTDVNVPAMILHLIGEHDHSSSCSDDESNALVEKGRLTGQIRRKGYKLDLSGLTLVVETKIELRNYNDWTQVIEAIKRMRIKT
jgi:hypothetical protein